MGPLEGLLQSLLWFTGPLSGTGKKTLANAVNSLLFEQGLAYSVLNGDYTATISHLDSASPTPTARRPSAASAR
jgi:adenylylsulfate kinase-like enzyme